MTRLQQASKRSSADSPVSTVAERGRRAPWPLRVAAQGIAGFVRGDKPLILGVIASLLLGASLLVGPAQNYLDTRARVEVLEYTDNVLGREVNRLEQRIADLDDPLYIELLAREQQGLIRPGEIPFRIIVPEGDEPLIHEPVRFDVEQPSWHERIWHQVQRMIGLG